MHHAILVAAFVLSFLICVVAYADIFCETNGKITKCWSDNGEIPTVECWFDETGTFMCTGVTEK